MSAQTKYLIAVIAVMAAVTLLLRAFPFLIFSRGGKCPELVSYIGRVLSPAAIAMLVVYCLCGVYSGKSLAAGHYGLPELLGVGAVVLLHVLRRNSLLSILGGTAVYMLAVQNF